MTRLLRRLFTLLSALSLLLCAATVVLWVRSYGASDQIGWRGAGGWREVRSAKGQVVVGLLLADHSGYPEQFHGPRYQRIASPLLAALPAARFFTRRRRLRRWRMRHSLCTECGYDLTANVSGVCPECGTAITKAEGK